MKRSQLKRKTPLARNRSTLEAIGVFSRGKPAPKRLKPIAHKGKTKHARRERSPAFMGWTARQPCMVARFFHELHERANNRRVVLEMHLHCEGPIQVDHAGDRYRDGDGARAFDRTCIPMCMKHHEQRTNAAGTPSQAGIFYGFSKEQVRTWSDEAIKIHQRLAGVAGVEVPAC